MRSTGCLGAATARWQALPSLQLLLVVQSLIPVTSRSTSSIPERCGCTFCSGKRKAVLLSSTNPGNYTRTPDTTTSGAVLVEVGLALDTANMAIEIQREVVFMANRRLTVLNPAGYQGFSGKRHAAGRLSLIVCWVELLQNVSFTTADFSGNVTINGTPSAATDAATVAYVEHLLPQWLTSNLPITINSQGLTSTMRPTALMARSALQLCGSLHGLQTLLSHQTSWSPSLTTLSLTVLLPSWQLRARLITGTSQSTMQPTALPVPSGLRPTLKPQLAQQQTVL